MSIELEQFGEGYYFLQSGNKVRIQKKDFINADKLCEELDPLLISSGELSILHFSIMNAGSGTYQKFTETGRCLWLKPGLNGKWFIGIDEILTDSFVYYIHELQRIYFANFAEHLRYRSDPLNVKVDSKQKYTYRPSERVGYIETPSNDPRAKNGKTRSYIHEPDDNDLYYMTYDMRLLIRSKRLGYAIWEIVNHSPLFEYENKNWGLKKGAGKDVTEQETIAAGKWLREELLGNNIKFK